MGLDIYMYRNTSGMPKADFIAAMNAASEAGNAYWELDEVEREKATEPADFPETRVDLDSAKYPDHLFRIGYFRSSYNEGGINNILKNLIGESLYSIMGCEDDEYCFWPDWAACKDRAVAALAAMDEQIAKDGGAIACGREMLFFDGDLPNSTEEAMALYRSKAAMERDDDFSSFSSKEGTFHLKRPLRVRAFIPGKGFMGPTVYVVYENDHFDSYRQSLEIVIETCDYVIASGHPEEFYVHWSG